jgi:hypothetical protein
VLITHAKGTGLMSVTDSGVARLVWRPRRVIAKAAPNTNYER